MAFYYGGKILQGAHFSDKVSSLNLLSQPQRSLFPTSDEFRKQAEHTAISQNSVCSSVSPNFSLRRVLFPLADLIQLSSAFSLEEE